MHGALVTSKCKNVRIFASKRRQMRKTQETRGNTNNLIPNDKNVVHLCNRGVLKGGNATKVRIQYPMGMFIGDVDSTAVRAEGRRP